MPQSDQPHPDPPSSDPPRKHRICTVTDDVDAVMRLAEFLAHLPGEAERTDLQLPEASAFFEAHTGEEFDIVLFAPRADRGAAPRMAQTALDAAITRSQDQIVLLPHGARVALRGGGRTRIVHGPPFRKPDLPPAFAASAAAPGESRNGAARARWFGMPRLFARPAPPPPDDPSGDLSGDEIPPVEADPGKDSQVIAFQSMTGGAGATTLAVNLAAEMARLKPAADICLIDFNLQFGNLATYLNIPTSSKITDAYHNMRSLDAEAFGECLFSVNDALHVFGAPAEILPFDALGGDDVEQILSLALGVAGTVILDLPHAIADWSEKVYIESDRIFCISTQEIRASQNVQKLTALLRGNSFPMGKFVHCLNRAPVRKLRQWRSNKASFEKGIGTQFNHIFTDGGQEVAYCNDFGAPIAEIHPNNPLRRELKALAETLALTGRAARPARKAQGT